jgi:hypothetical protein
MGNLTLKTKSKKTRELEEIMGLLPLEYVQSPQENC